MLPLRKLGSKRLWRNSKAVVAFASALLIVASAFAISAPAYATPPEGQICPSNTDGFGPKVDTVGDPATVSVSADAGMLIDKYCVKAGTEYVIVLVDPPAASVVIDYPGKDSVSHYSLHQIPIPTVVHATPAAPSFTPGTCTVEGSVVAPNTDQYTWAESGTDDARYLTASPVGNVILDGQTVYGPYDIRMDSGEGCNSPPVVQTETVTFANHTCDAIGTVTAPDVEGVRYEADLNGTVVGYVENFPAGTFYATDDGTATGTPFYGTITITAHAKDGYALQEGATAEWAFEFTEPDCTVTEPVEVTPTLTFTPGTCLATGSVSAVETDDYKWTVTGPNTAKVYTAVAKGDVTLVGQTIFGPYDLSQTNWKDASCLPTFTVEQSCGYVKVTYHNNSKWDRWPDVRYTGDGVTGVDYGSGLTYATTKVAAGTSKVIFEKTFAEDLNGGSVNVWYQDILGAERDIDTSVVELTVTTDCVQPPVVQTETVTFANHTCDAIGTVTAPDVEGVRYEADLNGTVVGYVENFPAGTFYATDDGTATGTPFYGTITITAHAKDGYALQEGATAEWAFEFTEPDCVIDAPVAPTFKEVCGTANDSYTVPTVPEGAHYTYSETAGVHKNARGSVTITAVADAGYTFSKDVVTSWTHKFTDESCGTLAYTGVNPILPLTIAGSLFGGGILALVWASRRRKLAPVMD